MANNYEKIFELSDKNNMGLSNTIKRDYGIPLDYSSVQESYEEALKYAQTSTLAYIGQPIAVGDTLYIVTDENGGWLKAVGTQPEGDNQSITLDAEGKVSLYGFSAAAATALPCKNAEGALEWLTLETIADGIETTKAVVKAADDSNITVISAYDEETDTYTYTLDVVFPAVPDYSIAKETTADAVNYRLTKDGTVIGETITVPNTYDEIYILNEGETEVNIPAGVNLAVFPEEKIDNTTVIQLVDKINQLRADTEVALEENENNLRNKADLIDGKVPLEQLPADLGSGGGLTEVYWEDIKYKPFSEDGSLAIEWNGNALSKSRITLFAEEYDGEIYEYCFVKVCNTPLANYADALNSHMTIVTPEDTVGIEVTFESIVLLANDNFILICDDMPGIINLVSNESPVDLSILGELPPVSFPSTGVYCLAMYYNRDYTSSIGYISKLLKDNAKTLNIRYLPKNMALGYETKQFDDIIWDGNTEGIISVQKDIDMGANGVMQMMGYKVSDKLFTKSQLFGSEVVVFSEGQMFAYELEDEDYFFDVNGNGSFLVGEGSFFVITENNTEADLSILVPGLSITFPKKGIWFTGTCVEGVLLQYTTGIISSAEITQIDLKYLPTDVPYGLTTLDYAGLIANERIRKSYSVSSWDEQPVTSKAVHEALQNVSVDMSNYYTKGELDSKLTTINGSLATIGSQSYPKSETYNKSEVYSKSETCSKTEIEMAHADLLIFMGNTYYDKTSTYNKSEVYNKNEVDAALANIDLSAYYKKSEIDALLGDVDTMLSEINAIIGGD